MNGIKKDTLVLGVGNEILTDDGVGPKLCDFLQEKYNDLPVQFEKINAGGLEILEFIRNYKTVIFIDAIKTMNGQIGTVYLYTPDSFKETLHLSNLHDTSFLTALELGKSLGFTIPERMYIIAVEIKEDMVFSSFFSAELNAKYDEVKQKTANLLEALIPEVISPDQTTERKVV